MELITGRTGTDHVLARHDALIHRTLLGDGDYVLAFGDRMPYTPLDASHIYIGTGSLIMQGRLCEITARESVQVQICSAANLKRKSIVVAEYTINNQGIEDVSLVAIAGNESNNTYVEPTIPYINGDIDHGETHQMPLYAVYVDGFAISDVEQLFTVLDVAPVETAMTYATTFVSELHNRVDQEITDMQERAQGVIPIMTASTRRPTSSDGEDGEFWVVYTV